MSSQFVPVNLTVLFGMGEKAARGYKALMEIVKGGVPDAGNKVQFVTI